MKRSPFALRPSPFALRPSVKPRLEMLESRDCPTVNVSVLAAFDGTEGQQDGSFLLIRDNISGSLSVNYNLVSQPLNGGPPSAPVSGTVTFAAGEEQAEIVLPMPQNDVRQGSQHVALTLTSGGGYTVYQPEPDHVLLTDDEDDDSIWIEEIQRAVEGGDVGFVRVGRADPTSFRAVPYNILSGPGMATMGVDYLPLSGTLVFLPGQRTAEVVIDAFGPFFDPATEGDETVTLQFVPPPPVGPAQPPIEAVVAIADARPVNQNPVFTFPAGKVQYAFLVGEYLPKNAAIGQVVVSDPDLDDNDKLRLEIVSSNRPLGMFSIDPGTKQITLAKPSNDAASDQYTLMLKVTDGRGGSALAIVDVQIRPLVVLTGDRHGVEKSVGGGKYDKLNLTFSRLSKDISQPLTITYEVPEAASIRQELTNPNDLVAAGTTTRSVTFPANESTVVIPLTLLDDGIQEDIRNFDIKIVPSATDVYAVPVGRVMLEFGGRKFKGEGTGKFSLLDATTLFAGGNSLVADQVDGGTQTVHMNDIKQGSIDDCYFMATIGAMAQRMPGRLDGGPNSILKDNGNGTATLTFYHMPTIAPNFVRQMTVDLTLDHGVEQAQFSGDYNVLTDEENLAIADQYEIWPAIMEKLYARTLHGGYDALKKAGSTYMTWQRLLGTTTPSREHLFKPLSTNDIVHLVQDAVNANQMVVLFSPPGGKSGQPMLVDVPGQTERWRIYRGHAYIIESINAGLVVLSNPWGREHAKIPIMWLKEFFHCAQIH